MDGERTGDVLVTYGEQSDDVLVHYGIKGMKWGIRKDRSSGGSKKKKKKKTGLLADLQKTYKAREKAKLAEAEAKRAANTRNVTINLGGSKSSISTISDTDLKAMVQRMSLEKQYRTLSAELQSSGKKEFKETAKKVAGFGAKSIAVVSALGVTTAVAKQFKLDDKQTKNLDQNLEKIRKVLEIVGK